MTHMAVSCLMQQVTRDSTSLYNKQAHILVQATRSTGRAALFEMRQVPLSLVVLMAAVTLVVCRRPAYIQCESSDECGKGACCVIGMGRYSIPRCQPHRELGEDCRPGGEPVNTTLSYPDDVTVTLRGVYYVHCPCLGGLACEDDETPVCTESLLTNHLLDYGALDDS